MHEMVLSVQIAQFLKKSRSGSSPVTPSSFLCGCYMARCTVHRKLSTTEPSAASELIRLLRPVCCHLPGAGEKGKNTLGFRRSALAIDFFQNDLKSSIPQVVACSDALPGSAGQTPVMPCPLGHWLLRASTLGDGSQRPGAPACPPFKCYLGRKAKRRKGGKQEQIQALRSPLLCWDMSSALCGPGYLFSLRDGRFQQ